MPLLLRSGNQRQLLQKRKKALIVPVFKSGDASVLDNYCGISLLSIRGKVYSMIIGNILKAYMNRHIFAGCAMRFQAKSGLQ